MSNEFTIGEVTRWLQTIEKRMGEMHGENRAGIAEVKASVADLAELQRIQNGNVAKLQEHAAVTDHRVTTIERSQEGMGDRIDTIRDAATKTATAGATQAIHDTAPSRAQMAKLTAMWNGVTSGGIIGAYFVIKFLVENMTTIVSHVKP